MRQVLQDMNDGETRVVEAPAPRCSAGHVVIQSGCSLISAGTERMLVDFGKAGWLGKAKSQPDKVRATLDKLRTDGLFATWEAVTSKLNEPIAMGYSNAGTVLEVGDGVDGIRPGDRVASNGPHAEIVSVPHRLCTKVPDGVGDDSAAFCIIASIALQSVRLLNPTIGERIAVTGLGLVGLFVAQILRANGCQVLAVDFARARCDIASSYGCESVCLADSPDLVGIARTLSGGAGIDGAIIAAATDSNAPVRDAANMCRKRGRIVLVGTAGLELSRAAFYDKELSFQVSCSYGPGRYDPAYERDGIDYPIGYVRWTQQRNFDAVLELMRQGKLSVDSLISHRFDIENAKQAYQVLTGDPSALGILLTYPGRDEARRHSQVLTSAGESRSSDQSVYGQCVLTVVGAGNYASRVLIPAFKSAGAQLHCLVSASGTTASYRGERAGFRQCSSDFDEAVADPACNAVVISTPHNEHASMVLQALRSGKHVFVEKPLALSQHELDEIAALYSTIPESERPILMVGYNRRFSGHVQSIRQALGRSAEPVAINYLCNAGAIPGTHWTQSRALGGGRIIGEACHFVDLAIHLAGERVVDFAVSVMPSPHGDSVPPDSAVISLGFDGGSIASLQYLSNGARAFPKERLEVFQDGRVFLIDNFRRLKTYGRGAGKGRSGLRQDKGQRQCTTAFVDAVKNGGLAPIEFDEIRHSTEVALAIASLAVSAPRRR